MCKHELAATIRLANEDRYVLPIDADVDVPQRARRFLSPTIAAQHTPQLPRSECKAGEDRATRFSAL